MLSHRITRNNIIWLLRSQTNFRRIDEIDKILGDLELEGFGLIGKVFDVVEPGFEGGLNGLIKELNDGIDLPLGNGHKMTYETL